jgi:hypothetical protein
MGENEGGQIRCKMLQNVAKCCIWPQHFEDAEARLLQQKLKLSNFGNSKGTPRILLQLTIYVHRVFQIYYVLALAI